MLMQTSVHVAAKIVKKCPTATCHNKGKTLFKYPVCSQRSLLALSK